MWLSLSSHQSIHEWMKKYKFDCLPLNNKYKYTGPQKRILRSAMLFILHVDHESKRTTVLLQQQYSKSDISSYSFSCRLLFTSRGPALVSIHSSVKNKKKCSHT